MLLFWRMLPPGLRSAAQIESLSLFGTCERSRLYVPVTKLAA